MKARFGSNSIRTKLFIGVLLTTTAALLVSSLAMAFFDLRDYHTRLIEDLTTQANILGLANAPALQFNDEKVARDSLATLQARPQILATAIYTAKGALFATYISGDNGDERFPDLPPVGEQQIRGNVIVISQPIVDRNEILGSIYIKARYQLYERVWQYVGILLPIAAIALLTAMLFSLWLQSRVAKPILHITDLARRIRDEHDYRLRAEKTTTDEIGYLVDAFNALLAEVGQRSEALELSNRQLQQQIQEREQADRALKTSENRYRTLVTSLTTIVWLADAEGHFSEKEMRWDEYTGQTPQQHQQLGWIDAFHPDDRAAVIARGTDASKLSLPVTHEVRLWHAASNSYHYVSMNAVPLYNEQGKLTEWIGTIDDIHERRLALMEVQRLNAELELRVRDRTAELERANSELEAFSYSVSHDLRTPLRAIDGFSQALLEDYSNQFDATGRDYLARVRAGAQRMGTLIDDLLKLARVSRATMTSDNVDMSALAENIIDELRSHDPARHVDIKITSQLNAYGDTHLLRIALENLLNNAWKYTGKREQAKIEFGMRQQQGSACFFIQDNGAGFDMTYADKLFGAFQRLHDAKDFAGTGVGLATVQRIVHRHGGRIWAEAAVDKGAVFYFTLPLVKEIAA